MKSLLALGCLAACLTFVHAQPLTDCTVEALTDDTIARLFAASQTPSQGDVPTITVLGVNIVCLTTAIRFGDYMFVSVVVNYTCADGTCAAGPGPSLSQVEFGCDGTQWSSTVMNSPDGNVVTAGIQADLTTPRRTDCAFCVNPDREASADSVNHCISCNENCSPEGLDLCSSVSPTGCCDFVQDDNCVAGMCTAPRTPDPLTFICGIPCDPLDPPTDAIITYSPSNCVAPDDLRERCVATYSCSQGQMPNVDDPTRTCEADQNNDGVWSGVEPMCSELRCELLTIENGTVSYADDCPQDLDCEATYMCDNGLELTGDRTRTCMANEENNAGMWTGTASTCVSDDVPDETGLGTGAIIGIVVGIVGGVLLIGIIITIVIVVVVKKK